jgi:hypothetical protein
MSKADKMFEKLGYEIDSTIYFEKEHHLMFCKDYTRIDFDLDRKNIYKYNLSGYRCPISMQELQAINEKVKELGWEENE